MARHTSPQPHHQQTRLAVPTTSEEDASDRDMPELAPICPPPPPAPSQLIQRSQQDDLEPDLGQKLSPLGSTSSLQDLIESNSAGEVASESQNTFTWTTLERQRMAKPESLMPEEAVEVPENGKNNLSACEDNSEDAEEHVTSYLEQPLLKVLEKKFTEEEDEGHEASRKSSSSGSYSVTSALAGQKMEKGLTSIMILEGQTSSFEHTTGSVEGYVSSLDQDNAPVSSFESSDEVVEKERKKGKKKECSEESGQDPDKEPEGAKPAEPEPECKPTPAMIRKHELTLDLQKEAASMPFKSPQDITSSFSPDESASENSIMWHRLPLGTGDVQKKRQAFERQIRCLSEENKPKVLNGKVKTPSSGGVRKIVSEERASGSPVGAGGGLARSPAMHSGFRTEDWVVERTPVNTPVNDRVLVGMINLSDEETSLRGSSEDLCKSSGATTPQGSVNSNSFVHTTTVDLTKTESEKTPDSKPHQLSHENQELTIQESVPPKTEEIIKSDIATQVEKVTDPKETEISAQTREVAGAAQQGKPAGKSGDQTVPLMAPPAGFGDSPEHVPHRRLPGFHEALSDQVMPQEELLIAEDFAPPAVATMHIAETFQTQEQLQSGRTECFHTAPAEVATAVTDYRIVEAEQAPAPAQSMERQTKRKMSSSSMASRTSGHSSHRSRSRSRSKERLLSKLAHSGEILITADEEDDIAGYLLSIDT